MDDVKPVVEVNIKKDVGPYDEYMTTNMVLGEFAQQVREAYIVNTPATEASEDQPATPQTIGIHAVVLDPQTYAELREIEWMYKDLTDESDPDNAQLDDADQKAELDKES